MVLTILPGDPVRLRFTTQPRSGIVGRNLATVRVAVVDAWQNIVTGLTGNPSIGLTLGTNLSGATLTGGGPVAVVNGVASFTGLTVDRIGLGYTLTASASDAAIAGATSIRFDVLPPDDDDDDDGDDRANVAAGGDTGGGVWADGCDVTLNNVIAGTNVLYNTPDNVDLIPC